MPITPVDSKSAAAPAQSDPSAATKHELSAEEKTALAKTMTQLQTLAGAKAKDSKEQMVYSYQRLRVGDRVDETKLESLPGVVAQTVLFADLEKAPVLLPSGKTTTVSACIINYHQSLNGNGMSSEFSDPSVLKQGLKARLQSVGVFVPNDQQEVVEGQSQTHPMGEYQVGFNGSYEGVNLYYRLALVPSFDDQGDFTHFSLLDSQQISNRWVNNYDRELAADVRMRAIEIPDATAATSSTLQQQLRRGGVLMLTPRVKFIADVDATYKEFALSKVEGERFGVFRDLQKRGGGPVLTADAAPSPLPNIFALTSGKAESVATQTVNLLGQYILQCDDIHAVWFNSIPVNPHAAARMPTYATDLFDLAQTRVTKVINLVKQTSFAIADAPLALLSRVPAEQPPRRIFKLIDVNQGSSDPDLKILAETLDSFELYCNTTSQDKGFANLIKNFLSTRSQLFGWRKVERYSCENIPGIVLPVSSFINRAGLLLQRFLNLVFDIIEEKKLSTDSAISNEEIMTRFKTSALVASFSSLVREAESVVTNMLKAVRETERKPRQSTFEEMMADEKTSPEVQAFLGKQRRAIETAGFMPGRMMIKIDRFKCPDMICNAEKSGWLPWHDPKRWFSVVQHGDGCTKKPVILLTTTPSIAVAVANSNPLLQGGVASATTLAASDAGVAAHDWKDEHAGKLLTAEPKPA